METTRTNLCKKSIVTCKIIGLDLLILGRPSLEKKEVTNAIIVMPNLSLKSFFIITKQHITIQFQQMKFRVNFINWLMTKRYRCETRDPITRTVIFWC